VSTAGDLARFFAQLIPSADTALLTAASRREMTRPQWRSPHSSLERHYGLGTMSGGTRDWSWFGHAGAFQGFTSQTAALPAHDLSVAVATNAIDGFAYLWLAGVLQVLATFARHGAPSEAVRDWGGRWWSIWSASDLVPMGKTVLVANPALPTPFTEASELTVSGPDDAKVALAGGFGSHGEPVKRTRDGDGKIYELCFAGGTLVAEERVAAELAACEKPPTPTGEVAATTRSSPSRT
jgi:hypothetical protein